MSTKRRKRHSAEQIVKKLRDAETMLSAGKTVAEVVQALEISEQSYYRWKAKYGGMQAAEAKRLKELEVENARLKKLLAEAELDKAMLKELASGDVAGQQRSSQRYEAQRPDDEPGIITRMLELVREHPRFGYRRIVKLLQREGHRVGFDRAYRLWRREGLQVPRKARKKRRLGASDQG